MYAVTLAAVEGFSILRGRTLAATVSRKQPSPWILIEALLAQLLGLFIALVTKSVCYITQHMEDKSDAFTSSFHFDITRFSLILLAYLFICSKPCIHTFSLIETCHIHAAFLQRFSFSPAKG